MDARLTWNANTEPDLAGYILFHGISSGVYTTADQVTVLAPTTTYTYTNLDVGIIHYFAVKAFDTTGNVSGPSSEVTKTEPYPVYPQHVRTRESRSQLWTPQRTEYLETMAGYLATAVGLNEPPPETFPIYEVIGGFQMV